MGKALEPTAKPTANEEIFTLISYEYYQIDILDRIETIQKELDKKSSTDHKHTIFDIELLLDVLNGLSVKGHTHTRGEITDFGHTHTIDNITNLQGELVSLNNEINNIKKALGDDGGPNFWDWLFGGINTGLTAASFAALQSQVNAIQGQILNMQAQIAALQSRLGMDIAPDMPSSGWFNRLSDWWNRVTRFRNDGYMRVTDAVDHVSGPGAEAFINTGEWLGH
jgi:hypothetical protein